ncbi:MAG: type II toxin-antitoxin system VapC family toxin [Acidobacteriota bacterium]
MRALFDSDILIDVLKATVQALDELERYEECLLSRISWIEVLVGASSKEEEELLRDYLTKFRICELDERSSERAVILRRKYKLKIPDAIIWATAQQQGCLLVTRNTKDFPEDNPGIRFPYQL